MSTRSLQSKQHAEPSSRTGMLHNFVVLVQEGAEVKTVPALAEGSAVHDNVRISPNFIEFTEASEGIICRQKLTLLNAGSRPARVRIRQPHSIVRYAVQAFQVKALKRGMMLNPGLSVSTYVTYSFKRPSLLRIMIPIEINEKIIDYRVICTLAIERINIEPKSIDFGTIDIGYSSGLKIITISNEGGKSTRFSIDLGSNDLKVTVRPMHGIVRPNKPVKLKVEFIAITEGLSYSEFWIKSTPNIRVPMKVNVIVPRLMVHHPNTTGDFTLIDFLPTVENTRRYETFAVRNISSHVANYVVLCEIGEQVKCIRDINRRDYPVQSAFEIKPVQGRIQPFEGIVFEVGFSPSSQLMRWREELRRQKLTERENNTEIGRNDFMAFMRIVRVHCTEAKDILKVDPTKDTPADESIFLKKLFTDTAVMDVSEPSTPCSSIVELRGPDMVRICLHGEVETARLNFEPDVLYFGDVFVGETSQRVVRLINSSTIASLTFRYVRNPAVRCYPQSGQLKAKGSMEVLLTIKGQQSVRPSFKIFFDAIVDSYESTVKRKLVNVTVGSFPVQCSANILFKPQKDRIKDIAPYVDSPEALTAKEIIFKADQRAYWMNFIRTAFRADTTIKQQSVEGKDEQELFKKALQPPKWRDKKLSNIPGCTLTWKKPPPLDLKSAVLIPLTSLQIYNVRISPTMFNFGMVASKSRNYRQLNIENTNDFPVMIRLESLSNEIDFPHGSLIILRPGTAATHLIEFIAEDVGKFNGYIHYVINNNHSFELSITADIIQKQLSLDKRELTLGKEWAKEESYRPMGGTIEIKNKLEANTCFKWEVPDSCFSIEPMFGTVRGKSSLYCYVRYEPKTSKANYTEITMRCEGGTYIGVRLSMPLYKPRLCFVNDSIDLGELPLALATRTIAVLSSSESLDTMFEVDPSSLPRGWSVQPSRGTVPPRGIALLEINLKVDACVRFAATIRVIVQKCLQLQLRIVGRVSFPRLKLQPESINVRRISVDAYQYYPIVATNIGTAALTLKFILNQYPEFYVSLSLEKGDSDIGNNDTSIAPGTSKTFYLHFQPIDVASYSLYLPIMMNDILGPACIENPNSIKTVEFLGPHEEYYKNMPGFVSEEILPKLPTVSINCTVTRHVIFFSKLSFYFNVHTKMIEDRLKIANQGPKPNTAISIKTDCLCNSDNPFSIKWLTGVKPEITTDFIKCTLHLGEEIVFIIEFKPERKGKFCSEIPIFVDGELDGNVFNKMSLIGEYPAAVIEAESSEIYLSPVPLCARIQTVLRLTFKNFENTAIISTKSLNPEVVSGNYKDGLLFTEFPNGNVFPPASHVEVQVNLIFKSDQPVSFCQTIEFRDDQNIAACSVKVFATADNCFLTTHAYFRKAIAERTRIPDTRAPRFSVTSVSWADEDDFDDNFMHRRRQVSVPKVGLQSYFDDSRRRSTIEHEGNVKGIKDTEQDENGQLEIQRSDSGYSTGSKTKTRRASSKLYRCSFANGTDGLEQCLRSTIKAAEEWLYSDPFKFNFYPNIPEGITASLSNILAYNKKKNNSKDKKKKKDQSFVPSFIDILAALGGKDVVGHGEPIPEDDVQRVEHIWKLYDRMLTFLLSQGALLAHVSPKFLLSCKDYRILISSSPSNGQENDITSAEFESKSKQCWLDVVLQTYKCFVLKNVSSTGFKTGSIVFSGISSRRSTLYRESVAPSISSLPRLYEIHEKAIQSIIKLKQKRSELHDNYSTQEMFLMSWLQYHYDEQRAQDWLKDKRIILDPHETRDVADARLIQNIDGDLSDSLVLIATTVAYCPFVVQEYFNNLYISPKTYEQALHNAICLVNAWRKIRLGFVISPVDIVKPNPVKMLMLVVHLFEALPTYLPRTKIRFSCPLTESVTRQITFTNPTSTCVNYLLLFIGNEGGSFTIISPKSILKLNSHDAGQVKISFHARKIKKIRAYLVLCGSAIGPHLGRNQTFILEGQADNLATTNKYVVRSKLYEIVDKTVKIKVPYEAATEYEILLSDERPNKPSALKVTRWSELCTRKIPRRLFLNQKSILVTEGAREARLSITVACVVASRRSFWLVFQSKLYDFIVQIISEWQTSLNDRIIVQWNADGECICSDSQGDISTLCPYNVTIPIPSRNIQLWSCIFHMFQKTLDPKERLFWSRYLDTHIGLRLIQWLMQDSDDSAALEYTHIFDTEIKYTVTITEKASPIRVPETFIIPDVRVSNVNVPMTVHILPSISELHEATLSLATLNRKELRVYTVDFLKVCTNYQSGSIC